MSRFFQEVAVLETITKKFIPVSLHFHKSLNCVLELTKATGKWNRIGFTIRLFRSFKFTWPFHALITPDFKRSRSIIVAINEVLTSTVREEMNDGTGKTFVAILPVMSYNPARIIHVCFRCVDQVCQTTIRTEFSFHAIFQSKELIADAAICDMWLVPWYWNVF